MPTIALVDDDRNILTSVSIALEAEGYRIMTYTDGASALEGFKTSPPDLAILDIKMPRMDGMELLRRLRQKTDMPVIFLTSKDEEIDELFGLKMGADDFIRKPFSQRLLVERVKAVLRRAIPKDPTAAPKETDDIKVLERGLLRMDPERHTCTWKGEPVTLTVTEFLILQALAARSGVVKSRNALMDAAYDDQVYVDDRTIDSHIKRLRKKFKVGRRRLRHDRDAVRRRLPLQGSLSGRAVSRRARHPRQSALECRHADGAYDRLADATIARSNRRDGIGIRRDATVPAKPQNVRGATASPACRSASPRPTASAAFAASRSALAVLRRPELLEPHAAHRLPQRRRPGRARRSAFSICRSSAPA